MLAVRDRHKETLWPLPDQETAKAVAERANETTDKEVVRLCQIADYAEILKIGEFFRLGLQEPALECSAYFAEKLTGQPVSCVAITSKNQSQKQNWATQRNNFSNKEGSSENVNVMEHNH